MELIFFFGELFAHIGRSSISSGDRESYSISGVSRSNREGWNVCFPINNTTTTPVQTKPAQPPVQPQTSLPGSASTPNLAHNFIMQRVSPLISSGKIPALLLSSFIVTDTTPVKRERNTRIITESRVLTSDEQIKMLRKRVEAKKAEEEEKSRRKVERERKKLEKERLGKEKEARKEERKRDKERKMKEKKRKAGELKVKIPAKKKVMSESGSKDDEGQASTSFWKLTRQRKAPLRYVETTDNESDDSDIAYDDEGNNCGVCKRKKAPQKKDGRKRDQ